MKSKFESTRQLSLTAYAFFMPISVSIKGLLLPLVIFLNFCCQWSWQRMRTCLQHPVAFLPILLYGWCVVSYSWAPADWSNATAITLKMSKLLFLPLFAIGFCAAKARQITIDAFLAAIGVTAIISLYMALSGHPFLRHVDPGNVFNSRIITGFYISIAAWTALGFAQQLISIQSPSFPLSTTKKYFYMLVFVLCTLQIVLANTSRTGIVLYCVLGVLYSLFAYTPRKIMAFMVVFTLAVTSFFAFNKQGHEQLYRTAYNITHYQENDKATNSSIGFRFQFHQFAKTLFLQKPLLGYGSGGFSHQYHLKQPVPAYKPELYEPHSQYWLTLVEQGLIGFGLLIAWLFVIVHLAFNVRQARLITLLTVTAFALGSLTDSLLVYSATGFLLIVTAAMALGEWIENQKI